MDALVHVFLNRGKTQLEETRVWEAAATGQEAAVAWDSTSICIKDVEDRAALVEREARERVSRVEAYNAVMLASAREVAE
jgi:hypothetical protein